MKITPTKISEVKLLEPRVFSDARGFFMETYQKMKLRESGISEEFVQDNLSGSIKGILRGLHYQVKSPQGKLVRAVAGEIFDVAVDLRKSSPTFGKWVSEILSAENKKALWVPPGFAHGFYVLSDWAEVFYKASDYYAPEWERSIRWDDPQIGIDWPLVDGEKPILSKKDAEGVAFKDAEVFD